MGNEIDMFKPLRFALTFCLALCPIVAFSGDGEGLVEIEYVGNYNGTDKVFFFTTNHVVRPACNTFGGRWVLDISTALGKAQYSLLLAAQSSGKRVRVSGANSCSQWSDSETATVVGYLVNYGSHP
jgi:hypothetical protein